MEIIYTCIYIYIILYVYIYILYMYIYTVYSIYINDVDVATGNYSVTSSPGISWWIERPWLFRLSCTNYLSICPDVQKLSGWWFEPLWKIWKSIGMIIPNIWENQKCSKPPTSCLLVSFLDLDWFRWLASDAGVLDTFLPVWWGEPSRTWLTRM